VVPPNPFTRRLDIRHILTHSPPVLDEVLPGLHAGSVGLIVGPGGIGKTMLELQMTVGFATGGAICGGLFEGSAPGQHTKRPPCKVLLVLAEESLEVVWHRLHAIVSTLATNAGMRSNPCSPADLLELLSTNIDIVTLAGDGPVQLMDQNFGRTIAFSQLQKTSEGARLVIIDPLRQFHQCDENSSAAVTAMAQHMHSLGYSSGAAILCAHHTNRASAHLGMGDAAGASRGSSALTDAVRWQLNLSAPPKDAAKQYGIAAQDSNRFLLLDLPKANYLAPQRTELLQRLARGVLLRVDYSAKADGAGPGRSTGAASLAPPPKRPRQSGFGVKP
jgi:RecA-family ATPase